MTRLDIQKAAAVLYMISSFTVTYAQDDDSDSGGCSGRECTIMKYVSIAALFPFYLIFAALLFNICVLYVEDLRRSRRKRQSTSDNTGSDSAKLESQVFCLPFSKGRFGLPELPPDHPQVAADLNQLDTQPGTPPTYSLPAPPPPTHQS